MLILCSVDLFDGDLFEVDSMYLQYGFDSTHVRFEPHKGLGSWTLAAGSRFQSLRMSESERARAECSRLSSMLERSIYY